VKKVSRIFKPKFEGDEAIALDLGPKTGFFGGGGE
jgi:hypothetical protein